MKRVGSAGNLSQETLRPVAGPRDLEILDNTITYCIDKEHGGSGGSVARRSNRNCQQTLGNGFARCQKNHSKSCKRMLGPRILSLLFSFLWCYSAYALADIPENFSINCEQILTNVVRSQSLKDIVDIHGLDGTRAQPLLRQYEQNIQRLESDLMDEFFAMNQGQAHPYRYECLMQKKKEWLSEVQNRQHFGFVDLQTVYYPEQHRLYSTLEIIDDAHNPRMHFITKPSSASLTQFAMQLKRKIREMFKFSDVIGQMQAFDDLSMNLLLNGQLNNEDLNCSAYHCLSSFQHPQLKPYWDIFEQGVVKDKRFILSTLQKDPDADRRAAAAFLVGHFHDPKEIIAVLSGSVNDSSSQVRNNALRVIAMTLYKSKMRDLDCRPFIRLLESPYVTDRNKALTMLLALVDDKTCHAQIIQQGKTSLQSLIQGKQPNNHDTAVNLWQKIQNSFA